MAEETATLRGTIPEEDKELLKEKFPASTTSDASLLRALIDDWRRLRRLEEMRASRPVLSDEEKEKR